MMLAAFGETILVCKVMDQGNRIPAWLMDDADGKLASQDR